MIRVMSEQMPTPWHAVRWFLAGVALLTFALVALVLRPGDGRSPAKREGNGEAAKSSARAVGQKAAADGAPQTTSEPGAGPDGARRGWILRGRVVRLSGRAPDPSRPVEGALVRLSIAPPWPGTAPEPLAASAQARPSTLESRSGPDGRFEIAGAPPRVELLLEADDPSAGYFALRLVLPPLQLLLPPASGAPDSAAIRDAGDIAIDPGCAVRVLVETVDHRPVKGAKVWLTHRSAMPRGLKGLEVRGSPRFLHEAGPGDFRLDRVSAQPHLVRVEAPGYAPSAENVRIRDDLTYRRILCDPRRFAGRVLSTAGEPIAGASIQCDEGRFKEEKAVADGDGRFVFERFPSTEAVLKVDSGGFCLARRRIADDEDEAEIRLTPEAVLSGMVLEAGDDRPVAGARVSLVTSAGPSTAFTCVTDPSGRFAIHKVEGGFHALRIEHPERLPCRSETLEVAGGARMGDLLFRLEPGNALRGRVRDVATGAGIAGASVVVQQQGSTSLLFIERRVEADAMGAFEALNLRPGEGFVKAEADGYLPGRMKIDLVPTQPPDAVLDLERGGVILVEVVGPGGEPVADAQVTLHRADDDRQSGPREAIAEIHRVQATDHDGRTCFSGLPMEVDLVAEAVHPDFVDHEARDLRAQGADTVQPTEIRLERAARIRVIVTDASGEPVPRAEVRASSWEPEKRNFESDQVWIADDGGVVLLRNFEPPRVWVYAAAPGRAPSAPREVPLEAAETTEVQIVLPGGRRLEGRVVGGGAPIGGALVTVRLPGARATVTSGPDGSFAVDGMPSGSWIVDASKPGWTPGRLRAEVPGPRLELPLEAMAKLRGQVEAPGTADLRWTEIRLSAESPGAFDFDDRVQVDSMGRFELRVPSGQYRVTAHLQGLVEETTPVELAAGETRGVTLRLEPSGRIDGVAIDGATGEPLAGRDVNLVEVSSGTKADFDETTRTGAAGEFSFLEMPSGVYSLVLVGGSSPFTGRLDGIVLRSGGAVQVRLEAKRSQGIRGAVEYMGAALPGAAITVRRLDGGDEQAAVSTTGGRFEVPDLPPGEYEVVASRNGRPSAPRKETVRPGRFAEVEIDLAVVRVEGRLLRAGSPVAREHLEVAFEFADDGWEGTWTDEFGEYAISLKAPGELEAIVREGDDILYRAFVTLPDAPQFHLDFELGPE